MEIIGLLGHQGVGKNYIAEKILPQILSQKNTLVLALADHFKVDCICKHGLAYDKAFGKKDFKTRKLLQKVGTEEGRNVYGSDIWTNTTYTWMKIFHERGIERFIISDLRFQNEVDWIKEIGGIVIKIEATIRNKKRLQEEANNDKDKNEIKNHISELGIDKISNYDIKVNNNPKDNISEQLNSYFNNK